jgi:hypothetical protein
VPTYCPSGTDVNDCGGSSSHGHGDSEFIVGFVKGYLNEMADDAGGCLYSQAGNFGPGIALVASGASQMAANPSSSSGWANFQSGLADVENGVADCVTSSWWDWLSEGVDWILDSVSPTYRVVSGVAQLLIDGYDIFGDIQDIAYYCGNDMYGNCGEKTGAMSYNLIQAFSANHTDVAEPEPEPESVGFVAFAAVGVALCVVAVMGVVVYRRKHDAAKKDEINAQILLDQEDFSAL